MKKYYIVPAEVFESNFPDDFEKMLSDGDVSVFETDGHIGDIAMRIEDDK